MLAQFGPVCHQPLPCASRLGSKPQQGLKTRFLPGGAQGKLLPPRCQHRGQGRQEPQIALCCNISTPAPTHCPFPALLHQTFVPPYWGQAHWEDAVTTSGCGNTDLQSPQTSSPRIAQGKQRARLHNTEHLLRETPRAAKPLEGLRSDLGSEADAGERTGRLLEVLHVRVCARV